MVTGLTCGAAVLGVSGEHPQMCLVGSWVMESGVWKLETGGDGELGVISPPVVFKAMGHGSGWDWTMNEAQVVKEKGEVIPGDIAMARGHGSPGPAAGGLIRSPCPSPGTVNMPGIVGWIVPCREGLSWHRGVFSRVPVVYPLDAGGIPLPRPLS